MEDEVRPELTVFGVQKMQAEFDRIKAKFDELQRGHERREDRTPPWKTPEGRARRKLVAARKRQRSARKKQRVR